jgi:hypothetical protein
LRFRRSENGDLSLVCCRRLRNGRLIGGRVGFVSRWGNLKNGELFSLTTADLTKELEGAHNANIVKTIINYYLNLFLSSMAAAQWNLG